ncbi:hypothetical protein WMY93_007003 [Mugilogobius chulae]|uniref:Uncharacterized protein n=1 Tax=Mugilogobius chulae TaxID=88201 RepID=A0AAW0PLJ6_9GOBI
MNQRWFRDGGVAGKNAARENEAGKSTGERDGPRENGAARGRTRRSVGEGGGPWENEAVRGRTGRPVGERDDPREYEEVRGGLGSAREMRRITAIVTQNARMTQHTYRRKDKAEGACPDAVLP